MADSTTTTTTTTLPLRSATAVAGLVAASGLGQAGSGGDARVFALVAAGLELHRALKKYCAAEPEAAVRASIRGYDASVEALLRVIAKYAAGPPATRPQSVLRNSVDKARESWLKTQTDATSSPAATQFATDSLQTLNSAAAAAAKGTAAPSLRSRSLQSTPQRVATHLLSRSTYRSHQPSPVSTPLRAVQVTTTRQNGGSALARSSQPSPAAAEEAPDPADEAERNPDDSAADDVQTPSSSSLNGSFSSSPGFAADTATRIRSRQRTRKSRDASPSHTRVIVTEASPVASPSPKRGRASPVFETSNASSTLASHAPAGEEAAVPTTKRDSFSTMDSDVHLPRGSEDFGLSHERLLNQLKELKQKVQSKQRRIGELEAAVTVQASTAAAELEGLRAELAASERAVESERLRANTAEAALASAPTPATVDKDVEERIQYFAGKVSEKDAEIEQLSGELRRQREEMRGVVAQTEEHLNRRERHLSEALASTQSSYMTAKADLQKAASALESSEEACEALLEVKASLEREVKELRGSLTAEFAEDRSPGVVAERARRRASEHELGALRQHVSDMTLRLEAAETRSEAARAMFEQEHERRLHAERSGLFVDQPALARAASAFTTPQRGATASPLARLGLSPREIQTIYTSPGGVPVGASLENLRQTVLEAEQLLSSLTSQFTGESYQEAAGDDVPLAEEGEQDVARFRLPSMDTKDYHGGSSSDENEQRAKKKPDSRSPRSRKDRRSQPKASARQNGQLLEKEEPTGTADSAANPGEDPPEKGSPATAGDSPKRSGYSADSESRQASRPTLQRQHASAQNVLDLVRRATSESSEVGLPSQPQADRRESGTSTPERHLSFTSREDANQSLLRSLKIMKETKSGSSGTVPGRHHDVMLTPSQEQELKRRKAWKKLARTLESKSESEQVVSDVEQGPGAEKQLEQPRVPVRLSTIAKVARFATTNLHLQPREDDERSLRSTSSITSDTGDEEAAPISGSCWWDQQFAGAAANGRSPSEDSPGNQFSIQENPDGAVTVHLGQAFTRSRSASTHGGANGRDAVFSKSTSTVRFLPAGEEPPAMPIRHKSSSALPQLKEEVGDHNPASWSLSGRPTASAYDSLCSVSALSDGPALSNPPDQPSPDSPTAPAATGTPILTKKHFMLRKATSDAASPKHAAAPAQVAKAGVPLWVWVAVTAVVILIFALSPDK